MMIWQDGRQEFTSFCRKKIQSVMNPRGLLRHELKKSTKIAAEDEGWILWDI
jgi:hypothetical protein